MLRLRAFALLVALQAYGTLRAQTPAHGPAAWTSSDVTVESADGAMGVLRSVGPTRVDRVARPSLTTAR